MSDVYRRTGSGCPCSVLDIEPDDVRNDFDYTDADLHPRNPDHPL